MAAGPPAAPAAPARGPRWWEEPGDRAPRRYRWRAEGREHLPVDAASARAADLRGPGRGLALPGARHAPPGVAGDDLDAPSRPQGLPGWAVGDGNAGAARVPGGAPAARQHQLELALLRRGLDPMASTAERRRRPKRQPQLGAFLDAQAAEVEATLASVFQRVGPGEEEDALLAALGAKDGGRYDAVPADVLVLLAEHGGSLTRPDLERHRAGTVPDQLLGRRALREKVQRALEAQEGAEDPQRVAEFLAETQEWLEATSIAGFGRVPVPLEAAAPAHPASLEPEPTEVTPASVAVHLAAAEAELGPEAAADARAMADEALRAVAREDAKAAEAAAAEAADSAETAETAEAETEPNLGAAAAAAAPRSPYSESARVGSSGWTPPPERAAAAARKQLRCPVCRRMFAADVIERHSTICQRVKDKQERRGQYDPTAKRLAGLAAQKDAE